jgi:hypothetical protein
VFFVTFTSVGQLLNTEGVVNVTPLGYLALIGLVVGICYKLFNWVTRLIKAR